MKDIIIYESLISLDIYIIGHWIMMNLQIINKYLMIEDNKYCTCLKFQEWKNTEVMPHS